MSRPTLAVVVWCMIVAAASAACGRSPPLDPQATDTLRPPTSKSMRTPTPTQTSAPSLTPTVTATPHDVPPVMMVTAPLEQITGEKVVLDASETFDWDGDEIAFSWFQLHNPNRYTGSDYVTGNEVNLEPADGPIVEFTPDWPGNYRFEVVATDRNGESRTTVNVAVYPRDQLFPIRGMAIPGSEVPWSEEEAVKLIDHLAELGFNYIQVGVSDVMESPTSNVILIDQNKLDWALSLDQNLTLIDLAHEAGLGVMLSPALGFIHDGTWYEFWNISPSTPSVWFESYKDFVMFYARLAEEHSVEILNLGGGTQQFHRFRSDWRDLISSVREVYGGRVAYSWFIFPCCDDPFPAISDLDAMVTTFNWNGSGISFTGNRTGNDHPSVLEMMGWFEIELARYVDPLQLRHEKPVIATDLYPFSVNGMNIHPVALYWTDDRTGDNQEPIDFAEAAFRVAAARRWEGIFFWETKLGPPSNWLPDIREKPIEDMIRIWFSPRSP